MRARLQEDGRSGVKALLILAASSWLCVGCRVDNPAFERFLDVSRESSGDDDDTEDDVDPSESSQEETDTTLPKPTTTTPTSATDASGSTSNSDLSTNISSYTPGPKPEAAPMDFCAKGAAFCYRLQLDSDNKVVNESKVHDGAKLNFFSPGANVSVTPPELGPLLVMNADSSAQLSQDFVVPSFADFGVDVWFDRAAEPSEPMVLVHVSGLMTIYVTADNKGVCTITQGEGKPDITIETRQFEKKLGWTAAACWIHQGKAKFWFGDSGASKAGTVSVEAGRQATVLLGKAATQAIQPTIGVPYQGSLHMLRIWEDTYWVEDQFRSELRAMGLEPPS